MSSKCARFNRNKHRQQKQNKTKAEKEFKNVKHK